MSFVNPSEILDTLDDGVFVLAPNGNVLYVNNAMANLYGVKRERLLTWNVFTMHEKGDIVSRECLLAKTLREGRKCSELQVFVTEHNTTGTELLSTQSPIFDGNGNILYTIGVLRKIQDIHTEPQHATQTATIITHAAPIDLVAKDYRSRRLLDQAALVATSDASVLITGETGVGKEVYADFIHRLSGRSGQKIIKINCAALPDNLLEAELFGYVKGAFTGALSSGRRGLIEEADGGTLFLDEINSMSLAIQGKFLRALDQKAVRRIGSNQETSVNFRLLAATNANLWTMVQKGAFRSDLYYRCNVVPFHIPPLRERRGDIAPLCRYYTQYFNEKYGVYKSLDEDLLDELSQWNWSGNVRELKNFVERLIVLTAPSIQVIKKIPPAIQAELTESGGMPFAGASSPSPHSTFAEAPLSLREQRAAFEAEVIERTIRECGSISAAAKQLQIDRTTLLRKKAQATSLYLKRKDYKNPQKTHPTPSDLLPL